MQYNEINGTDIKISRVAVGGHYKAMEEGRFEERYACVDKYVEERLPIIKKAVEGGINYFDTTWRNEVDILAEIIRQLDIRDKIYVNGMVLGAFGGPEALGMDVDSYFNRWLDERLKSMPGGRFDTFMINAIEENYDPHKCEKVIRLLEERVRCGEIVSFGFSTHDPCHARAVLDTFPEFKFAMLPYNFSNRKFEDAFSDYKGQADFIAMKPLVWKEYGIPFCAVNTLNDFEARFGFTADHNAAAKAISFILTNKKIITAFNAVNSINELEELLIAGDMIFDPEFCQLLDKYNDIQMMDGGLHLYLSALSFENLRMKFFALSNLSRLLRLEMPPIPLNSDNSYELLCEYEKTIRSKI